MTDADALLLSNAIVMMRATNPKNLNLPYMLEAYIARLNSEDEFAKFNEMFLRHVPQPAPNDRYLASDQLSDKMLSLLRLHFGEDSGPVIYQKCGSMNLKHRVNKPAEADEFYQACRQGQNLFTGSGSTVVHERLDTSPDHRQG